MKYYYNPSTNLLLIDENDYTPYLADRGYEEVTKEFYDAKSAELAEQFEPLNENSDDIIAEA